VTGDGEPASASVSLISELPTPAAIRMTTTTIAQNHQRFQKGVELRGASGGGGGGGGGGGSWSIAEELCAAFAEPSTRGTLLLCTSTPTILYPAETQPTSRVRGASGVHAGRLWDGVASSL
jgi:hypothetical protein